MLTVCDAGLPAPAWAVKLRLVALRWIKGAAVTVNVTATFCGLLFATPDVTATVAVYVPAAKLPVVTPNVSVAGAVVVFKLAFSQPVGCPAP